MFSWVESPFTDTEIFETIYKLAKSQNEEELRQCVNQGICVDFFHQGHTPVSLLAEEGDDEAVRFLLNRFGANLNRAVEGYARGNHAYQLGQLIRQYGSSLIDAAIVGYAMINNSDQIAYWSRRKVYPNGILSLTMQGYARGGYLDKIKDELKKCEGDDDQALATKRSIRSGAVLGCAMVGNFTSEGDFLTHYEFLTGCAYSGDFGVLQRVIGDPYLGQGEAADALAGKGDAIRVIKMLHLKGVGEANMKIPRGYAKEGIINQIEKLIQHDVPLKYITHYYQEYFQNAELTLRILTFINDSKIRKNLALTIERLCHIQGVMHTLNHANKINHLMKTQGIDYQQARALSMGLHFWFLLIGNQLVKEGKIPAEIFLYIASYICELPEKVTENLYQKTSFAVHKQLAMLGLNQVLNKTNWLSSNFFNKAKVTFAYYECGQTKNLEKLTQKLEEAKPLSEPVLEKLRNRM